MSNNVGNVLFGSGRHENVGVTFGIASPSVSAQKLFPLPVSWPIFEFPMSGDVGQCRTMSALSYSGRTLSKMLK